ncbi:MAG: NAD-dependent malic enzyme [Planctomycetes bacterium]|nr:NAD-dependent malic enzyme [Planctomycetota bacterium]MCC7399816.1 NAD-dependent malic enzyme [Planctomycetota bacterium]
MDPHFTTRVDPATGLPYLAVKNRGRDLLANPLTNKGTGFTPEERDALGLHGLLPPKVADFDEQLARAYENHREATTPLGRYVHLATLQDRNEVLFYRLLHEHIEEMMPIVYTPVVGEACQRFSHIYRQSRGLYVGIDMQGRVAEVLRNFPITEPSVIVVTDGERILGLGDQGIGGMGIPIGKLSLYTLCAGLPPETTLPITLDVGTDNQELLHDPLYLGLRHPRVRGEQYQDFVDEFVAAVREVFPTAVLQWEDFLKENAMHQLLRFRNKLCSFNDDIQGTAAVTVAGLIASLRITGGKLAEQRLLLGGAGASAQGIAQLFVLALREAGLDTRTAHERIFMVDRSGLVLKSRPGLGDFKAEFAHSDGEIGDWQVKDRSNISLQEAIENLRPTMLIGTSATAGFFTEAAVRAMAKRTERPVIFPLSNPTSKAECTPADALRWTDGRAVIATGSPFAPVDVGGHRHRIGQCNNSYVFPGIGLGAWVGKLRHISDEMFLDASHTLADMVAPSDLSEFSVFPRLSRIREVSLAIACAVIRRGIHQGHADASLAKGLEQRVKKAMWFPEYLPFRAV